MDQQLLDRNIIIDASCCYCSKMAPNRDDIGDQLLLHNRRWWFACCDLLRSATICLFFIFLIYRSTILKFWNVNEGRTSFPRMWERLIPNLPLRISLPLPIPKLEYALWFRFGFSPLFWKVNVVNNFNFKFWFSNMKTKCTIKVVVLWENWKKNMCLIISCDITKNLISLLIGQSLFTSTDNKNNYLNG